MVLKDDLKDDFKDGIKNNPDYMAVQNVADVLGQGDNLNKVTDKVTDDVVDKVTDNVVTDKVADISKIFETDDKTLEEDLGWINYYRKMFRDNLPVKEEEESYFSIKPYKERALKEFSKMKELFTNNVVVKTSKALIENKMVSLAQSLAEMMNLVKAGENVADLKPEELEGRVANLTTLLERPEMQEKIAEMSKTVVSAAKDPLKDMSEQLSELSGKFVQDMTEQGAQIGVTALGAIPGPGNVLSVLNAAKKTSDLVSHAVGEASKAMYVLDKTGEKIGENLEEASKIDTKIINQVGGAKAILKRVNRSLKEHFAQPKKHVTRKSLARNGKSKRKRIQKKRVTKNNKK